MSPTIRSICTAGLTLTFFALLSPTTSGAQATATKCKDGTTSATSGRGACSGHGGVDVTATKATSKTVKAQEKTAKAVVKKTTGTQVTSTCADGSTSNATGRGTCSGHGGVKGAVATSKATGAPAVAPVPLAAPKPKVTAAPKSTVVGSGAADDKNPAGAIAQCKDGMYSHAKNRTGACSRHGGVARWM
jgi:serine/threonine-protein kinase